MLKHKAASFRGGFFFACIIHELDEFPYFNFYEFKIKNI